MKSSAITRSQGISKKSMLRTSWLGERKSVTLTSGKQNEREIAAQAKRRTMIQKLRGDRREAIADMDFSIHGTAEDVAAVSNILPLGEEGLETSHEGGEYEVFENLAKEIASSTGSYRRIDSRTRQDRTELQTEHWLMQMDELVNAYLAFQSNMEYDGLAKQQTPPEAVNGQPVIVIEVVDLFFRKTVSLPIEKIEIYANQTLLRHGYLGCSPLAPTVAITVRSLLAYRQTHRTCPRYSLEAFSKTLCHLHNVPFHNYLQKQLASAFDIYLEINRQIDKKLNGKLGYDTPRARLIRQCPPCFFKQHGEPDLDFSVMVSMDGNNSLKRVDATTRKHAHLFDSRTIDSDYWLTVEEVDVFKDEIAERPERGTNEAAPLAHTDGEVGCADRWKNAGPDQCKHMFALFEETGVFVAACRHRTILYGCDMIKSGELSKYPLAVVNRLIQEVGEKIGCAYDIGCTFDKTLNNSSLGQRARESKFRLMVGAFHGYAHNRACQLEWHPLYMKGTGRTEGEGCEHIFSSSNDLARGTRHASRFHRHQAIAEHFAFWNQDKYALLSTYIINHYWEAIEVIEKLSNDFADKKKSLGCCDDDFNHLLSTEQMYLANLEQPDPVIETKKKYVGALRQLAIFSVEWEKTRQSTIDFRRQLAITGNDADLSEARYQAEVSYGQVQNAEALVTLYEIMLGISQRWSESSPEYQQYYKENVETSFRKAVDELERAVVMRILELTKMKATGTGYKLRQQILKALNRRSDAVRRAIKRYNDQAKLLDPPAPAVTWEEIAEFTFIGEFDLLRITRCDIRQEKWTQKEYREAAVMYYKLCRAREEIQRLNIKVCRLIAFIHEEKEHIERVIKQLSADNLLLAGELHRRWAARSCINELHLQRLKQLKREPYYSGSLDSGLSTHNQGSVFSLDSIAEEDWIQAENEQEEEFETVANFVAGIVD